MKHVKKKILIALVVLLVILAAALAGVGNYMVNFAIVRSQEHRDVSPASIVTEENKSAISENRAAIDAQKRAWLSMTQVEKTQITSADGLTLVGQIYWNREPGHKWLLGIHGYTGKKEDAENVASFFAQQGYNVLLPDQRAHGHSGGHTITMGAKEQYDAQGWANWAAERFGLDTPLFLMGVSMGAATVMLASGLPLPSSVKGIVADCGYTSAKEITRKCLPDYLPHTPVWLAYAVGRLGARLYGHFEPNRIDCTAAVSRAAVPILFIHGEEDGFVPCEMSRKNYDACASRKQLLTIPGAAHAVCYYRDTPLYTRVTTKFFEDCLHG